MISQLNERALKLRECSNVRRAHGIPHVGEYTVGKHSFDALALLLEIYPDASRDLIIAVVRHDFAERWVGDIPCTACWDNEDLNVAYRKAEAGVFAREGIELPALNEEDQFRLKLVDKLELYCWAQEQLRAFGNCHVGDCIKRLEQWFESCGIWGKLPGPVATLILSYEWKRL